MSKRLLHIHETQVGQTVFLVPLQPGVARGPGLAPYPSDGSTQRASEYVTSLQRRGAVALYVEEPAAAEPEAEASPLPGPSTEEAKPPSEPGAVPADGEGPAHGEG